MIVDRTLETAKRWDENISYQIFKTVPKNARTKSVLKGLEWSCNGIIWLTGTLILFYLYPKEESLKQMMAGLIMDIVYVAFIKAWARRRRPNYAAQDDQFGVVSVDKHSFPSGHATRAIYVACFFSSNHPIISFVIWIWTISVTLSRVFLGRHHVTDVAAGVFIGFGNYFLQFIVGLPLYTFFVWFMSSGLMAQFSNSQDYTDATLTTD
jgi:hypothetical protein